MAALFDIPPSFPPGFSYYPDFLTEAEERLLLSLARGTPVQTFSFQGYEARRRTASYGYDYHFNGRYLSKGRPIPDAFHWLIEKVAAHLDIAAGAFKELLVTQYPEGAVINWHRDAPPFGLIAGVSLQTDCTFKLRPYGEKRPVRSFPVARRSLYIMEGEARSEWQHSTAPVDDERWAVTLRTLSGER
ncbi:alpha-ketoglutarate-dependent dioxygenase AlkB [Chitinophaga lutea]